MRFQRWPFVNILITGAKGQIGTELVPFLGRSYPDSQIFSTDIDTLDVTDASKVDQFIGDNSISQVFHLAALLSGVGERSPRKTFDVNLLGSLNILEASRDRGVLQVFIPSSIAVFGRDYPRDNTPNDTVLRPLSMYGVTKVAGEVLHEYYTSRYGLDVRSLRFPGILSSRGKPGGGTTDYAIHMLAQAAQGEPNFVSFLKQGTRLPFLHIDDVLEGIVTFMNAPREHLSRRVYNVTGFSAAPEDFMFATQKHGNPISVTYEPDFRQAIADQWPRSINDTRARKDWGWRSQLDLEETTLRLLKDFSEDL